MSKTIKNMLIFLVVLAVIAAVYFLFFSKTKAPSSATTGTSLSSSTGSPVTGIVNTTVPSSSIEASKVNQEFINQLLNLKAIKLNDEVFSSLSFQSLEDFTIILVQPGNEGRPNPFAPFGTDSTGVPGVDPASGGTGTINIIPIEDLFGLGGNGS